MGNFTGTSRFLTSLEKSQDLATLHFHMTTTDWSLWVSASCVDHVSLVFWNHACFTIYVTCRAPGGVCLCNFWLPVPRVFLSPPQSKGKKKIPLKCLVSLSLRSFPLFHSSLPPISSLKSYFPTGPWRIYLHFVSSPHVSPFSVSLSDAVCSLGWLPKEFGKIKDCSTRACILKHS